MKWQTKWHYFLSLIKSFYPRLLKTVDLVICCDGPMPVSPCGEVWLLEQLALSGRWPGTSQERNPVWHPEGPAARETWVCCQPHYRATEGLQAGQLGGKHQGLLDPKAMVLGPNTTSAVMWWWNRWNVREERERKKKEKGARRLKKVEEEIMGEDWQSWETASGNVASLKGSLDFSFILQDVDLWALQSSASRDREGKEVQPEGRGLQRQGGKRSEGTGNRHGMCPPLTNESYDSREG